ncbi:NAD(P)/FAD-dependent oxidoreductase [Pseudomonas sp. CR3202]|uniref:NAD(P)/FAD-dependent oxidoreductase n=1 Tax=Pseudomonas sp. CR3202 TaxID=3351532 RepID=UPI003BF05F03
MAETEIADVVVVGAGVVGIATALQLRMAGMNVVLVDQNPPASGASSGNAGAIAISEVLPLADVQTLLKVPKWLFDSRGPLAVRWRHLPTLAPWLTRFVLAGRPSKVECLTIDLAVLLRSARADWQRLIEHCGLTSMWRPYGALMLYASRHELEADLSNWELRGRHGVRWEKCTPQQVGNLEPNLLPTWNQAVSIPDFSHVDDPYLFSLGVFSQFVREGGRFVQSKVRTVLRQSGRVRGVELADGIELRAPNVIIASGVWSDEFAKPERQVLPLESERGYHLTLPKASKPLKQYLMNHSESFVILPMANGGVRIAGTVELASRNAEPDYRRAQMLLERAEDMVGPLNTESMTQWMGNRPSVPETVPVIGPSDRVQGMFFATGHGHLGLTLAATTGAMLRDHLLGVEQIPAAYLPSRYSTI